MEIKHVSRFLIVALCVNAFLMLSAIITLTIFRMRVSEYKPAFPVTDKEILDRIGLATFEYLTNYTARVESNQNSRVSSELPKVLTFDFVVYGALRGDRVLYHNCEFSTGDYIDIDKQVYLIMQIDFQRQRLYLRGADGGIAIGVAGAPARPAGRTHGTPKEDAAAGED